MRKTDFFENCGRAAGFLTGLWAFFMLTVFPLYMKEKYIRLGEHKYHFFLRVSIYLLLPAGLCWLLFLLQKGKKLQLHFSCLDRAMLAYLAVAMISFLMSVDKRQAWSGIEGWYMGLLTQVLLVLSYFLVSRCLPLKKVILAGHFLASSVVFLLGCGHRFGLDPLGLYEGIDESWRLLFLSTVGQASWYSGYVCTVLVIGVACFFTEHKPVRRFFLGCHCAVGFATVVTQNSDSAFMAMLFLMLGLFLAACDSPDNMERFFETALLMLGSFKLMGSLQQLFPDRAMRLDGLSEFISQSTQTWLLFLAVCVGDMLFLLYRQKHPKLPGWKKAGVMRRLAVGAAAAAPVCYACVVWLNSTGRLKAWFGIESAGQYWLFDSSWGNSRGFIWSITWEAFKGLPVLRKLFGVGPDCYAAYCYSVPEMEAQLNHFFGQNQTLTNAHNEFLNLMLCMGIAGLAAFCMMLTAAFLRFYKEKYDSPYVFAGMLAALVYGAHNFFCYQQICCTPFLFLLLGMAEGCIRRNKKDIQKTAERYEANAHIE